MILKAEAFLRINPPLGSRDFGRGSYFFEQRLEHTAQPQRASPHRRCARAAIDGVLPSNERGEASVVKFAQAHPISDVCILVEDLERSIRFYVDQVGFALRRRAPGFADFHGAGLTLALWEIDHISANTGVSDRRGPGAHKVCVAVALPSPAAVDECYAELSGYGVTFQGPPADYSWNARCCYFAGPDDELWELYAWLTGGPEDSHTIAPRA